MHAEDVRAGLDEGAEQCGADHAGPRDERDDHSVRDLVEVHEEVFEAFMPEPDLDLTVPHLLHRVVRS